MVILKKYMVDYIRLTTFSQGVGQGWRSFLMADIDRSRLKEDEAKFLQYKGFRMGLEDGSVFWGEGSQGKSKRRHWVLSLSGRLADRVFFGDLVALYAEHPKSALINCSRIDLQVTHLNDTYIPKNGRSLSFLLGVFSEMNADGVGRATGWIQDKSGDGAVATVSINKRTSTTYYRIYAKPTINGHAIRYEVEYKGEKAKAVTVALLSSLKREKIGRILKNQLDKLASRSLRDYFSDVMPDGGDNCPVTVGDGDSNTVLWLMSTVLPSFARVINGNERGGYVARGFMEVLAGSDWGQANIVTDGELDVSPEVATIASD